MNPIFNEYLTFLRDTSGKQLFELKEGYFWLDNQIIKGFDKQGNIHKFYRIKISVSSLFFQAQFPKIFNTFTSQSFGDIPATNATCFIISLKFAIIN